MLHAGKALGHGPDALVGDHPIHGGNGGHVVFDVVDAGDADVGQGQDLTAAHGVGQPDGLVPEIHTLLQLALPAEQGHASGCLFGQLSGDVVVEVKYRPVPRLLVEIDVPLGVGILLHGVVIVQVVGGQVGEHGHVGAEGHGHQLEGGQLHHDHVIRRHAAHVGQQGLADVAAHVDVEPGLFQKLADEGGGGGLAVASRHAEDLAGAQLEEQLHLRGDLPALLRRLLQLRVIGAQAGGTENHVKAIELVQIVLPQLEAGTQALQLVGQLLHPLPGGFVAHRDLQAGAQHHADKGGVAHAHADDGNRLAPQGL